MATTSSAQTQLNHSSGGGGGSERNSNPNIVGSNPNLNNLLNRGTTIDNHNNTSRDRDRGGGGGERHSRHHAPPLSSMREYCLRWNNHQPNLVSFFTNLLSKESFVDVTLVSSEGRKIQAHKLVLSACSPYFQVSPPSTHHHPSLSVYHYTLTGRVSASNVKAINQLLKFRFWGSLYHGHH